MEKRAFVLENVEKSYDNRTVLSIDCLEIKHQQVTCIIGPSGSGKSTLLNLLGLLVAPDISKRNTFNYYQGEDTHNFIEIWQKEPQKILRLRKQFAFIFQESHLLSHFSAADNARHFSFLNGNSSSHEEKIQQKFKELGLEEKMDCFPYELSGGERQRVAIIKSLARGPSVVLADEPTANLDPYNRNLVLQSLGVIGEKKNTVVIATHDLEIAKLADVIFVLNKGKVHRNACNNHFNPQEISSDLIYELFTPRKIADD